MILSDDHQKKPTGDAMPSLSEPFVLPKGSKDLTQSSKPPQKPAAATRATSARAAQTI